MRRWPIVEAFAVGAAILVAAEIGKLSREPERIIVEPPPPAERPLPRFPDPTVAPEAMTAECRAEGKQLLATKSDSFDWTYDCVNADATKKGTVWN